MPDEPAWGTDFQWNDLLISKLRYCRASQQRAINFVGNDID